MNPVRFSAVREDKSLVSFHLEILLINGRAETRPYEKMIKVAMICRITIHPVVIESR